MNARPAPVTMEIVTDPAELERARESFAQYDRNMAWFQAHAAEIFATWRGKHLCVSGQELFVADSAEAALAEGRAKYPDDEGRFLWYVPLEKVPRICADRRLQWRNVRPERRIG